MAKIAANLPPDLAQAAQTIEDAYAAALKESFDNQLERTQQINDIDTKFVLLKQAYDSIQARAAEHDNSMSYVLSCPNPVKWTNMTPIPILEEEYSAGANVNVPVEDTFNQLRNMSQAAEAEYGKLARPLTTAGATVTDPDVLNKLAEVRHGVDDVGGIHYEIVKWGLFLDELTSLLYDKYHARRFLSVKAQVEMTLGQYHAHSPYLAVRVEEQELLNAQSLAATASALMTFLSSREFALLAQGQSESAQAPAAPKAGAALPPQVQQAIQAGLPPAAQEAAQAAVHLVATFAAPRVNHQGNGEENDTDCGENERPVGVHAFQVAPPVQIDLDHSPIDIARMIQSTILLYVDASLRAIQAMKVAAESINFNIYKFEFGSVASARDNISQMDALRSQFLGHFMQEWERTNFMPARAWVVDDIHVCNFRGAYGAGAPVQTIILGPGEKREMRVSTQETTKEARAQSKSVFDSFTDAAQASLQESVNDELDSTQTDTTAVNTYLDTSSSDNWKGNWKLGTKLKIGRPKGVINADVDFSMGQEEARETGTDAGTNTDTTSSRVTAGKHSAGTLANHQRDITAKRDTTVTENVDTSKEAVREESMVIETKNPNSAAPMTLIFTNMVQEYVSYTCLVNVHVLFSNGVFKRPYAIEQMNLFLDNYIIPDEAVRARIWNFVRRACRVVDYLGNEIDLLDTTGAVPVIKDRLYTDLLELQADPSKTSELDVRYAEMKQYKKYIPGVVMRVDNYTLPVPGLFAQAIVGRPALDDNEQAACDNTLARQAAEAESAQKKNLLADEFIAATRNIDDPVARANMLKSVLMSGKDIFSNVYLDSILMSSLDGQKGVSPEDVKNALGLGRGMGGSRR